MKNKCRDYRDYIQDILNSIDEIEIFTEGMSFEEFTRDKKTIDAVTRSVEVIGEGQRKSPKV